MTENVMINVLFFVACGLLLLAPDLLEFRRRHVKS